MFWGNVKPWGKSPGSATLDHVPYKASLVIVAAADLGLVPRLVPIPPPGIMMDPASGLLQGSRRSLCVQAMSN